MNIKVSKTIMTSLSSVMIGTAMAANLPQVTLVNGSPSINGQKPPLEVVYQIAYKNPNQPPVLSKTTQTIKLFDKAVIPIDLNGYAMAGIVPISIGGHSLPPTANQFDVPEQCSVAITEKKRQAMMTISLYPHKATCVV